MNEAKKLSIKDENKARKEEKGIEFKNDMEKKVDPKKVEKLNETEIDKLKDNKTKYKDKKDELVELNSDFATDDSVSKNDKNISLLDSKQIGAQLLAQNSPDYAAKAVVESVFQSVKKEEEINLQNNFRVLNIAPLNDWKVESLLNEPKKIQVVNEIPKFIHIYSEVSDNPEHFRRYAKSSGFDMNSDFLNLCMNTFRAGTKEVKFMIKTSNTYKSIEYDPASEYQSTFKIQGYDIVTGEKSFHGQTEVETLCSMLTLIFEIKDVGNVVVADIETTVFLDRSDNVNVGPLIAWKNKKIPKMNVPHILFGTYKHTLNWFIDHVQNLISVEDVQLGEYGSATYNARNKKISSYYAVTSDNYLCDLYELHQQKIDSQTFVSKTMVNVINGYAPSGTRIELMSDEQLQYSKAYFPNIINAQQYCFVFLLSGTFRQNIRAKLEALVQNSRGIVHIGFTEVTKLLYSTVVIPGADTTLDKIFTAGAEKLSLSHFYQMMVINKCHAFIDVSGVFPFTCKTAFHATAALLYIMCDALIFPSYFWTNLHIYILTLYEAFEKLDNDAYIKMTEGGFTKSYDELRDLTKKDLLNGEIPMMFRSNQLPASVSEYLKMIQPIGEMVDNGIESEAVISLSNSRKTYIPFKHVPKSTDGKVARTRFHERFKIFRTYIGKIITKIVKRESTSTTLTGTLSTQLTGAVDSIVDASHRFGATAHYELQTLFKALNVGPEIPYETFNGVGKINLSLPIGLVSNTQTAHRPIIASDVAEVFPGVGIYALMTIVGDHIAKDGSNNIVINEVTTYMHHNPVDRFKKYIELTKNVEELAEQFGILTYIMEASSNENDPWGIFIKLFGRTFKSGLATQILQQLLKVSNVAEITKQVMDENIVSSTELRLNKPIVTQITQSGIAINDGTKVNKYFNNSLVLLSDFEKSKLEISLELVSGINSPIHRYIRGVTVKRQFFDELSPTNRHDDVENVIDYDGSLFKYITVEGKSFVAFNYLGNLHHRVRDPDFPKDIGLEITNPAIINEYTWNFLSKCVEAANWILVFPELLVLADVYRVNSSYAENEMQDWSSIRNAMAGSTLKLIFYDTSDSMVNQKIHITNASYLQYICALSPIERNLLARSIEGFELNEDFIPIDKDSWTFGNCRPFELSRFKNNRPKYKSGKVNFNNLMRVWTNNAIFNEYPEMRFVNTTDGFL
jgi:hypothetical protein